MRRGFNLLELIVVIVILVALAIILIPAVGNVKRAAVRVSCMNQFKLIGQSAHRYRDAHDHFPPGTAPNAELPPEERMSFYALLLPYLDAMKPVHDKLKFAEPWDAPANRAAIEKFNWSIFLCHEWSGEQPPDVKRELPGGLTLYPQYANYVGLAGVGSDAATRPADAPGIGFFGYDRALKPEQVKDGLSSTIMLTETAHELAPWIRGGPGTVRTIDPSADRLVGGGLPFGGTHYRERLFGRNVPNGFISLLADGGTHYSSKDAQPAVLIALATIAGGEDVPGEW
jgi:prepilin-type N-terminal cleavage/methylation domain-containing protein